MVMAPLAVSRNRVAAWSSRSPWPTFRAVSRFHRSAATPARGAISTVGKRSAKAMMPSQAPDSVRTLLEA